MALLADIQASAIDSTVPLADLLRRCKVLAAHLKHKEFADWVDHELTGYLRGTDVPLYRQLRTPSSIGHFSGAFGSGINNMPIPVLRLPEQFRDMVLNYQVREPARQVEIIAANSGTLELKWPGDLVAHVSVNFPMVENTTLVAASRLVDASSFAGIVDNIRTKILDFALAIAANYPDVGEGDLAAPAKVPSTVVHQVFNNTIVGGQANIGTSGSASIGSGNVAAGQLAGTTIGDPTALLPLLSKLREEANAIESKEDRKEALDMVKKMEKQSTGPKDNFNADKMLKYLSLYSTLVTAASNTMPQLEHALTAIKTMLGCVTRPARIRHGYRSRSLSGARIARRPWEWNVTATARPNHVRSSRDAGTSTKRAPSVTTAYPAPSGPICTVPRKPSGVLARNSCPVRAAIPSPTA